jgi:hypothetical protein
VGEMDKQREVKDEELGDLRVKADVVVKSIGY